MNVNFKKVSDSEFNSMTRDPKTFYFVYHTPPSWASASDADIAIMLQKHYEGKINLYDYWNVGDERVVHLNAMSADGVGESHIAQDVTMVILNKGGKTLTTPIGNVNECAFIVGLKNTLKEDGYINPTSTNSGGWDSCARRTWCNTTYKNSLPSTLVGIFKEHQNVTGSGMGKGSTVSNDYFALVAEKEIASKNYIANIDAESSLSQFEYYKNGGLITQRWTRSPNQYNSNGFVRIGSNEDDTYNDSVTNSRGIAPFGCI